MPYETLEDKMYRLFADRVTGVIDLPYREYEDNPVGFARDILRITLWDSQEKILKSVRSNKNTAVGAAVGTGKSFAAAAVALWWLNTRKDSKVICTAAPPKRQIKDILFANIRMLHTRALEKGAQLLGGDPKSLSIEVGPNHWLMGFTIPQSGTREERIAKFHGHHAAGGILVIGDEANGIPPEIITEGFDNVTSAADCRQLLLSNPFVPSGPFWNATRSKDWHTITISAFDHPNVKNKEVSIPGAIDYETTRKRVEKYTRPALPEDREGHRRIIEWEGEERVVINPVFMYKTLGEFPWEAEGTLIPMAWFQRARRNYDVYLEEALEQGYSWPVDVPPPVLGLDVAEMGADFNTLCMRYDYIVAPFERWNGLYPYMSADKAARFYRRLGASRINVDAIGVGSDVAPLIRDEGLQAYGINVNWSATSDNIEYKYYRLRDQLGWEAREWFQQEHVAVPPDEEFEADCFAYQYENTRSGIRITSKNQIKSELGRSPDGWDAFCMSLYEGREGGKPAGHRVGSTSISRKPKRTPWMGR